MNFSLRAATLAAFALTAVAAAMASDASLAGAASASVDSVPSAIRAPQDAPLSSSSDSSGKPGVTFAAPGEVVQPLATAAKPATADEAAQAVSAPASLSSLVSQQGEPENLSEQMQCLAGAVYFESKGESLAGQLAVARVIINRMKSGRFADSLCGVVYQPGQFSFVRGRAMPAIATAGRAWKEAVAISQIAITDSWNSLAEGALYFHARRVSPSWGRAKVALIDNHIFYR
ncbi:MAG TPA: cell wall hydrolase [Sphingobium sp.]